MFHSMLTATTRYQPQHCVASNMPPRTTRGRGRGARGRVATAKDAKDAQAAKEAKGTVAV
jgi:hypothetical protein